MLSVKSKKFVFEAFSLQAIFRTLNQMIQTIGERPLSLDWKDGLANSKIMEMQYAVPGHNANDYWRKTWKEVGDSLYLAMGDFAKSNNLPSPELMRKTGVNSNAKKYTKEKT